MGMRLQAFIPGLPPELSPSRSEWDAMNADGVTFPVELSISRVLVPDDRLYTAIIRDISERRAQQGALEHQASHDPLTGLPNRAALARMLARACANADASKPVALFMLDLCRFKEVNDTLGHTVGDRVLCEVVRRFRETLGEDRFLARLGGDEFTVVIEDLDVGARMQQVVAELQHSLAKPLVIEGVALEVGVSIGVSLYPLDAPDADALLKHADVAMFASKRHRTAYECYNAAHDPHSLRRLTMVSELRAAIGTPSLALHYQPKINLRASIADSVEALMRWQHATYGGVSPTEFIGVAEATDLIVPLTDWTLQQALDQVVRWRQAGLELTIAVNLSARVLQDVSFPERLRNLFARSDACPHWLEIEVTEDSMMADPERARHVLNEVHEIGVRVSVDDYGTGYSSLGYLRNLPIHALKLDKSFVQNMRERADDRIIVESTVQMARALKLEVVAEGIETEWDARFLMSVGCDYGQGFWFSKALPAQECEAWVRDFNTSAQRARALQASGSHRSLGASPGF
jgi:diguanylate cyclase (GGDEF)-like protein